MRTFVISARSLVEFILRSGDIVSSFSGGVDVLKAQEGTRLHQKLQKAEKGDYTPEVTMTREEEVTDENGTVMAILRVEGRADGLFTLDRERLAEEQAAREKSRLASPKKRPVRSSRRSGQKEENNQLDLAEELPSDKNAEAAETNSQNDLQKDPQKNSRQDSQKEIEDDLNILDSGKSYRTVDEIKSVEFPMERLSVHTFPLHWAQAKVYAALLAEQEEQAEILVRLTYIQRETEEVRHFFKLYSREELRRFYAELIEAYDLWVRWQCGWDEIRTASLLELTFPFETYRPGQRTMAAYVYRAIDEHKKVLLQAPTGIGKTMSALFPALKAQGEEKCEKIFYLTAKNVTGEAAERALEILRSRGMRLKSIRITAKDRICILDKRSCRPEDCPRARGHFDRINAAALEALQTRENLDQAAISEIADRYQVCPYELSLDIASWCDLIICDFNYVFDPTASLKRFFAEGKHPYTLLIDEAHNLVDRARSMFTASLDKQAFSQARKFLPKDAPPARSLGKINRLFVEAGKAMGEETWKKAGDLGTDEDGWLRTLSTLTEKMGDLFEQYGREKTEIPEELWELYFAVLFYIHMAEEPRGGFADFFEKQGRQIGRTRYCVDPSELLSEIYKRVDSVVFFSATVTPVDYYKTLLGIREEEEAIALPSPFDKRNRQMLVASVPMTYRYRETSLERTVTLIRKSISVKPGHYLVFFPSYSYLLQAAREYGSRYGEEGLLLQSQDMTEEERNGFLRRFREDSTPLLGFAVLGGVFSEGVDLKGDSLIGTVVVSVGLPQLCKERDLIREFFDRTMEARGFDYAYVYPGIGRVFQAAGRVIRTETDRGFVLLLDSRFGEERYLRMYPEEWFPLRQVDETDITRVLEDFWREEQERTELTGDNGEQPETV